MSTKPDASDCTHPTKRLSNPRVRDEGDPLDSSGLCAWADCECGVTVLLDCEIQEVMEF